MLMACASFIGALALGTGDTTFFAIICVASGLALGADLMLPPAIQADVIDLDTLASGQQRAGFYFAIWGFATKLALAAAAGIAFPTLAYFGLDPSIGARAAPGLLALSLLYAGLPVALKLAAIALMWRFDLSPQHVASNAAALSARRSAAD